MKVMISVFLLFVFLTVIGCGIQQENEEVTVEEIEITAGLDELDELDELDQLEAELGDDLFAELDDLELE